MIRLIITDNEEILYLNENKVSLDSIKASFDVVKETELILSDLENDDNNISKLYFYKNIEMYTFFRGSFATKLREIVYYVLLIDNIKKRYENYNLKVETNKDVVTKISEEIFGIKAEPYTNKEMNLKYKNSDKILMLKRIILGTVFTATKLLSFNNKTLIITQAADVGTVISNDKNKFIDVQYGKLLSEIKKSYKTLRLQYLNSNDVLSKASILGNNFIPYEIITLVKKIISNRLIKHDKICNNLNQSNKYVIKVNNIDLSDIVDEFLFKKMESVYISYIKEIEIANIVLKLFKINKVIATGEADRARCFITAANMKNIQSFGIQHGIISKVSYPYLVPTDNLKVIPNCTFVWGETYKEVLVENTKVYNENNIKIVGQLRTDFLFDEMKKYKKNNNSDNLKIFYATQPIQELRVEATNILFKSLAEIDDYEVLIKLHPGEKDDTIYYELAKKYKIKNLTIVKEMDIYQCIFWCNYIVTVHSTVALEGALLGKNSICILLSNYFDEGNFVKDKISIGVENAEELKEIFLQKKKINFSKATEKSMYKIDGKVCKRIIDTLNKDLTQ